jgi:glycogenin glucosyltransferase
MNFPSMHYEMSEDVAPFVPPERYPSPPKDMWYQVPKERPAPREQKPKAIFPWETQRPQPSRTFINTAPQALEIEGVSGEAFGERTTAPESRSPTEPSTVLAPTETTIEPMTPTTPTIKVIPSDPWTSFTQRSNNLPFKNLAFFDSIFQHQLI